MPSSGKTKEPRATIEAIQEYADSTGLTPEVDRESGVIRGVKILGLQSKNKRRYTPECVAAAIPLYEGRPAFVDHVRPGQEGPRSYRDKIGVHRNIRQAPDTSPGLVSDFHLNLKHPLAESILWDAENAPQSLGFSHDAQGRIVRKGGEAVVEEILSVASCDLVCRPATTNGLFEDTAEIPEEQVEFCEHGLSAVSDLRTILLGSDPLETKQARLREVVAAWAGEIGGITRHEESTMEWSDITLASLRENRKDLADALAEPLMKAKEESRIATEALEALRTQYKAVTDKLAEAEAEKARQAARLAIAEELKAAKVDPDNKAVCTEAIMEQLLAARDAEARRPIISLMAMATRPAQAGSPPFGSTGSVGTGGPGATAKETLSLL